MQTQLYCWECPGIKAPQASQTGAVAGGMHASTMHTTPRMQQRLCWHALLCSGICAGMLCTCVDAHADAQARHDDFAIAWLPCHVPRVHWAAHVMLQQAVRPGCFLGEGGGEWSRT
eukprot:366340-Chlamydomonas_euryale.AAC.10